MNNSNRFPVALKTCLAAILALALLQFGAAAVGSSSITFVACANKDTGALRVTYKTCTEQESNVNWETSGPQSATGLSICKSRSSGALALRTTCTSTESRISNNIELVGKTGEAGQIGASGLTGLQGLDGNAGAIGANGGIGIRGLRGAVGIGGHDGNDGSAGTNGEAGSDGNDGSAGTNGEAGSDGNDGSAGTNGEAGSDGNDGSAGTNGEAGSDGNDGSAGTNGEPGIGLTDASIGKDCLVTLRDKEAKGFFIWVETAAESGIYIMGCDTSPMR